MGTVLITWGQYQDVNGPIAGSFRFEPMPGGTAVKVISSDFDCAAGPGATIVPDGTYMLWMQTGSFVIAAPVIVDSAAGGTQDMSVLLATSTTPAAAFGPGGLLTQFVPGIGALAVPGGLISGDGTTDGSDDS